MQAITLVLAAYDGSVICEATHPRTGIQATDKFKSWPPNSGELKEFCDGLVARNARHELYMTLPKPNLAPRLPPPAGLRGEITWDEVKAKHAQYFEKKACRPPPRDRTFRSLGDLAAEMGVSLTPEQIEAIPEAKKAG